MKGVLLARSPRTPVVDLCHEIDPQDVSGAALALRAAVPYYPAGCVFVVVVDPGVGSARRILWARSRTQQFLAPDNGVLSWLTEEHAVLERRCVRNRALFARTVSGTFHGRDVFAPVAAALSKGLKPARLGPALGDPVVLPWPGTRREAGGPRGVVLTLPLRQRRHQPAQRGRARGRARRAPRPRPRAPAHALRRGPARARPRRRRLGGPGRAFRARRRLPRALPRENRRHRPCPKPPLRSSRSPASS